MHILLTDVLVCPRCGSGFGLVLRADRLHERRVVEGGLGCSNCRETFPVREGVADLRFPPGADLAPSVPAAGEEEDPVLRLAALLGLAEGGGLVLLAGPAIRHARGLATLLPEIEAVPVGAPAEVEGGGNGVSPIAAGLPLPFIPRSVRAAALSGSPDALWIAEGVRVLAPSGRLLLEGAPPGTSESLRREGMDVLLEQGETIVAVRR